MGFEHSFTENYSLSSDSFRSKRRQNYLITRGCFRDQRMPILKEETAPLAFACSFFLAGSGVKAFHSLRVSSANAHPQGGNRTFGLCLLLLFGWVRSKSFPQPQGLISTSRDQGGGVWRKASLQHSLCVTHQLCYPGHGRIPPDN